MMSRVAEILEKSLDGRTDSVESMDLRRDHALRAILGEQHHATLQLAVRRVLLGDSLVAWVEDAPAAATAVNVANFAWGLYVLPKRLRHGWLLWNLENLHAAVGAPGRCLDLVRTVEQLSLNASLGHSRWLEHLQQGAILRLGSALPARPKMPAPLVLTIPSFNDPQSVTALLDALDESAEVFGWSNAAVVIFDASNDPRSAREMRALAEARDRKRIHVCYVSKRGSFPKSLPDLDAFSASHRPSLNHLDVAGMFNSTAGGNLNTCFSYFGPDVAVLNFDHDVLPSVEVPIAALSQFETSDVSLADDVVRFEVHGGQQQTRRLPVDFMHALRISPRGFSLSGTEVVEGDDESYKTVRLSNTLEKEAEFAVGHICGVQDHSARFLLELQLTAGQTLAAASPPRFVPRHPVFPALVSSSKLITTTMTYRRHDLSDASLGFVGTGVRVQDFLTGAFHRALTGRPVFWAPVYLTHNRRYGLRGEAHYGSYLLNEEYMYLFLNACRRLDAMSPVDGWDQLFDAWSAAFEQVPIAQEVDGFLDRALDLEARLRETRVDSTYDAAATAIREAFWLSESREDARAFHLGRLQEETKRVATHLKRRPEVNALGRKSGLLRFQALGTGHH